MAVYEERKTVFTITATCSTLYDNGMSYRGPVNYTSNGRACVDWQHHVHGVTPERYPYDGLEENYCRNPRGHQDAPWCYTSPENDGSKIWDYCPVRKCGTWSSKWKQRDVKWDLSAYEITRADSGWFLRGGGGSIWSNCLTMHFLTERPEQTVKTQIRRGRGRRLWSGCTLFATHPAILHTFTCCKKSCWREVQGNE